MDEHKYDRWMREIVFVCSKVLNCCFLSCLWFWSSDVFLFVVEFVTVFCDSCVQLCSWCFHVISLCVFLLLSHSVLFQSACHACLHLSLVSISPSCSHSTHQSVFRLSHLCLTIQSIVVCAFMPCLVCHRVLSEVYFTIL